MYNKMVDVMKHATNNKYVNTTAFLKWTQLLLVRSKMFCNVIW
jgi:hypothetical protein